MPIIGKAEMILQRLAVCPDVGMALKLLRGILFFYLLEPLAFCEFHVEVVVLVATIKFASVFCLAWRCEPQVLSLVLEHVINLVNVLLGASGGKGNVPRKRAQAPSAMHFEAAAEGLLLLEPLLAGCARLPPSASQTVLHLLRTLGPKLAELLDWLALKVRWKGNFELLVERSPL